jgi:hypothetical protein
MFLLLSPNKNQKKNTERDNPLLLFKERLRPTHRRSDKETAPNATPLSLQ